MTILTREQITNLELRAAVHRSGWSANDADSLIDTARAYHDLRDAVLALCDEWAKIARYHPTGWLRYPVIADDLRAAIEGDR